MRRFLFAIALLLVPAAAEAQEPRLLEGSFQLGFGQPRCIRAPCPPARWIIWREGLHVMVPRVEVDPATPAPLQAAIARASGLNPSRIEGSIRIEDGVATILVRQFTPIRRR